MHTTTATCTSPCWCSTARCGGEKVVSDANPTRIAEKDRRPGYPNGPSDSAVTPTMDWATVAVVITILEAVVGALLTAFRSRAGLVVENLALCQQLAVLRRRRPRPQLRPIDRAFWVMLSRTWSRWSEALAIVKPTMVIGWHRRGFARFW